MKYEFTDEVKVLPTGERLYRIIALQNFGDVKSGDRGGFIQSMMNLSVAGNCWVYDEACVYEDAIVSVDATIRNEAQVYGSAGVIGNAIVFEGAKVCGTAQVLDRAQVFQLAYVYGAATIRDHAQVAGTAQVFGKADIAGQSQVSGETHIYGNASISGNAKIFGNAHLGGDTHIRGTQTVHGFTSLNGSPLTVTHPKNIMSIGDIEPKTPWKETPNFVTAKPSIGICPSGSETCKFIIESLVQRRKKLGVSSIDLLQEVGISPEYLIEIEENRIMPDFKTVCSIAAALGLRLSITEC